ncbi:MAG: hypothetical protein QF554_03620 [Dehalococcoidia bacterium]|jgi:hypothetical protein|nr:hypothetical protein [Dehalococcoidia bacterium]
MNQPKETSSDAPSPRGPGGPGGDGYTTALHTALVKLIVTALVSILVLVVSALIYSDQADLYDSSFVVSLIRQVTAETVFQPIFLVVVLVPIFIAAARNVSWLALGSGGLILLSVMLPYARFEYIDAATRDLEGAHNSLFQLAGPGHRMPEFVSVLTLMLLGGATALFWRIDRRDGSDHDGVRVANGV